jgi:hypothetical protein
MRSLAAVLTILVAACGTEPDDGPVPVTSGAYHHYVTSALRLPTTAVLQKEYGLNLNPDADPAGKPDNQLGNVFVALTSNSSANLQGIVDGAIADGSLVLLHSVRADALAGDGSVAWQVYVGAERAAPPLFDGSDAFEMGEAVASEPVVGATRHGSFAPKGAGQLTVQLKVSESQPAIALDLIAARVEATVDEAGCSGRLGGAITEDQLHARLLPAVVKMMNDAIDRDPACPAACTAGTSAALIVEVFDKDKDGHVTLAEIEGSPIMQTLLAPDLDLAGDDGVPESISLGLGFDCVAARFDVSAETP